MSSGHCGHLQAPPFTHLDFQGVNVGLYIHTQSLDTTSPAGRAIFGTLAVFGEFEREMIVARTKAGIARARAAGKQIGRTRIEDNLACSREAAPC